jgi:aryl-alcohol dehydrogenase-like predicted oxidoreductase
LPDALRGKPLSQQALQVVLSLPGVSCVLNGIRHVAYVDDSLGAMALPSLTPEQALAVLRELRE